jgi:hypothetical protein
LGIDFGNRVRRVLEFGLEFRGEDCDVLLWQEFGSEEAQVFIMVPNPLPNNAKNKDCFAFAFDTDPTIDDLVFTIEACYIP